MVNIHFTLSLQNAFFSLYLLNNFSTLVDQATLFTEIAGYTHRYVIEGKTKCLKRG